MTAQSAPIGMAGHPHAGPPVTIRIIHPAQHTVHHPPLLIAFDSCLPLPQPNMPSAMFPYPLMESRLWYKSFQIWIFQWVAHQLVPVWALSLISLIPHLPAPGFSPSYFDARVNRCILWACSRLSAGSCFIFSTIKFDIGFIDENHRSCQHSFCSRNFLQWDGPSARSGQ